jgi:hypothetical protein
MARKSKIKIFIISITVVLLLLLSYLIVGYFPFNKVRRDWKNAAITEILRLANDKKWIAEQIAKLDSYKDVQKENDEGWWVASELILMKKKEWLIYKSHCNKRAPHNVYDIFIAKGSDGNWYYSTYHFCIDMFTIKHMSEYEQSEDLKVFISRYSLKAFDEKSDECLQKTWPVKNKGF